MQTNNVKAGPSHRHGNWCRLLAVSVILPAALLLAWVLGQEQGCKGTKVKLRNTAPLVSSQQQQPRKPAAYLSSTWEQQWMAAATKEMVERDGAVCKWMAAHNKQVEGWLAGVASLHAGASAHSKASSKHGPSGLPGDIFSRFKFPGSGITAPIEPLVGHLR